MVQCCFVNGCTNYGNKDRKISYFSFPAIIEHQDDETRSLSVRRRRAWVAAVNRTKPPTRHSFVCSDHFLNGKPARLHDWTNPDWIPSRCLSEKERQENENVKSSSSTSDRYNRKRARIDKQKKVQAAESLLDLSNTLPKRPRLENVESDTQDIEETTVLTDAEILSKMRDDYQRVLTENMKLRSDLLKAQVAPELFKGKDEKVRYYTGLPSFVMLLGVFNFLKPNLDKHCGGILNSFQLVILVLSRMRLNLQIQDLAFRFRVSRATASRQFLTALHVMFKALAPLIHWPEREQLRKTMPLQFRQQFGVRCAVIIDCFEIFCERPSSLLARAQTWSQYKSHNTVKYLIGITPQGTISYISKGWGGRTPDKYLTEHCGFLKYLLPGDVILADRGFNISELVATVYAEVKVPAFTRGKSQLSPLDVEMTRKLAHFRVHVERLIGLTRNKYTILQSVLPIAYFLKDTEGNVTVDKMVVVACALCNCCESIITKKQM